MLIRKNRLEEFSKELSKCMRQPWLDIVAKVMLIFMMLGIPFALNQLSLPFWIFAICLLNTYLVIHYIGRWQSDPKIDFSVVKQVLRSFNLLETHQVQDIYEKLEEKANIGPVGTEIYVAIVYAIIRFINHDPMAEETLYVDVAVGEVLMIFSTFRLVRVWHHIKAVYILEHLPE